MHANFRMFFQNNQIPRFTEESQAQNRRANLVSPTFVFGVHILVFRLSQTRYHILGRSVTCLFGIDRLVHPFMSLIYSAQIPNPDYSDWGCAIYGATMMFSCRLADRWNYSVSTNDSDHVQEAYQRTQNLNLLCQLKTRQSIELTKSKTALSNKPDIHYYKYSSIPNKNSYNRICHSTKRATKKNRST